MVDHPRENWNDIFDSLQTLSDHLEAIGFDELYEG
jgi:hypothetical protein